MAIECIGSANGLLIIDSIGIVVMHEINMIIKSIVKCQIGNKSI